jgi:hypothetical protein
MRSIIIEFKTLQDMQETLQRMNITDITTSPDEELLVQVSVDDAQCQELLKLKSVTFIDEM